MGAEVLSLDEPVIFNCTGLGAATLFGDDELVPARGQLVFVPPDDRIDYLTIGGGESVLYMFPRSDGLCCGTFERGASHLTADAATTERIVREHARISREMRIVNDLTLWQHEVRGLAQRHARRGAVAIPGQVTGRRASRRQLTSTSAAFPAIDSSGSSGPEGIRTARRQHRLLGLHGTIGPGGVPLHRRSSLARVRAALALVREGGWRRRVARAGR